jgi:hypothetical protein
MIFYENRNTDDHRQELRQIMLQQWIISLSHRNHSVTPILLNISLRSLNDITTAKKKKKKNLADRVSRSLPSVNLGRVEQMLRSCPHPHFPRAAGTQACGSLQADRVRCCIDVSLKAFPKYYIESAAVSHGRCKRGYTLGLS